VKPLARRIAPCVAAVLIAGSSNGVLGWFLAGRDVIGAAIERNFVLAVLALALLGVRVFLYFVAPGWIAYLTARALSELWGRSSARGAPTDRTVRS
jgi:hypothetical protein